MYLRRLSAPDDAGPNVFRHPALFRGGSSPPNSQGANVRRTFATLGYSHSIVPGGFDV